MSGIDDRTRTELEAAVFRRLVEHLRNRVIQLAHGTLVYDLHQPVRYSPIL